ncbi:MAG: DNA-processing protein DprA [Firmicutes bacterium]|jgi:DNA processing protein|nr:DNA-processing protein DprA [Bacillota bacterium]
MADVSESQSRLLALCAIRIEDKTLDWSLIARETLLDDGLDRLWQGQINEKSKAATAGLDILCQGIKQPELLFERVEQELEAASKVGARLLTVLDKDYPVNLRLISNLPPFLFIRGEFAENDIRSVAVVGTRLASANGIRHAKRMTNSLVEKGVTVVSGLARGIDTEAHRSAIESGGRTIAVLGTGITKCYPPENRDLAEEIADNGALVSQFWPTRAPGRDTFPRRNVVTSGLAQGTVVVEASSTSGAKMQARLALEHGKKVFLLKSLVTDQEWAKKYVQERGAIEVEDIQNVISHLAAPERIRIAGEQRQQLSLSLL